MAVLRREFSSAERIPCSVHLTRNVVKTIQGDYLQSFRLGGASFESADDVHINNWHERLNVLWRNIGVPDVAVWTHVIRRRELVMPGMVTGGGFAGLLSARYRQRLAGETLMVNELYLSLVHRPAAGLTTGLASRVLRRTGRAVEAEECSAALEICEKLAQAVQASLARYEPERLGAYRAGQRWRTSLLEFLGLLVNGEWQPVPLPDGPVNEALATTRLVFGTETIEYRTPTTTRVGAILGIKEYATPSVVGMYNRLLAARFPLVLTQSFTFLSKAASQGLLQRQAHRLANAGDLALSQTVELKGALDALASNEFVMGDHHFSLQVLAEIPEPDRNREAVPRLRELNEHVASARNLLADTGLTVAREDLALEAAFWAQLPGNFPLRPRKAPITSRNFAAMSPFHNHPTGRASGNHWGEALTMFMTSARSPYHFSLHASDPRNADGESRRDTGHTLICGPTGSGKTVLIGFIVAMAERMQATQVIFDKDRGLEILVRALGGEYLPIRNGEPTGFNPLQLPPTSDHVEFLKRWLALLVQMPSGRALTVREQADLDQGLLGTLALDRHERRLSRVVEHLDATDPEGVHNRLARWCEVTGGAYAWVFDNAEDTIAPRLAGRPVIGFDVTDFLDHETTRSAVTLYLFHLVRQLLDGRRLVCWMDEFWRLLSDPAFESFARDAPKTWRKLNGVMCFATQSISDVLDSPICRTIVEQTATKIFFPNSDASAEEYVGQLGLTQREYRLIREQLEPASRMFLVKQGHHSVVCQLNLMGFDAELDVISGRAGQLRRFHAIIARTGADPARWLPEFMASATPN
ncbi:MAG TPA: VirB4 family type IV secretion/conjugal transfer ATPase [Steroidobacteraceae bacterium]|nr:VirB4 family type IV secretion/conjugal transfer ATPase [Steroidobacteraceae bacterium]